METGEIEELHFVQVDHALLDFLVPGQVSLLLGLYLRNELSALDWVVFAVQSHEVPVQGDRLHYQISTMMSLGVTFAFEYTSQ